MTPGAAGTASYRTRGETVAQDETDAADLQRLRDAMERVADELEREKGSVQGNVARLLAATRIRRALRGEAGR